MIDELEMMVDFEDNENEKNDEPGKDKEDKSKASEFSLDISDPNNISADKSPIKPHKVVEDLIDNLKRDDPKKDPLRGSSKEKKLDATTDSCNKKTHYKNQPRDLERKKRTLMRDKPEKADKSEKKLDNDLKDKNKEKKVSKNTDPYYFILKFSGDNALYTCLDNNFIILSPGLSLYSDIIEVKLFS